MLLFTIIDAKFPNIPSNADLTIKTAAPNTIPNRGEASNVIPITAPVIAIDTRPPNFLYKTGVNCEAAADTKKIIDHNTPSCLASNPSSTPKKLFNISELMTTKKPTLNSKTVCHFTAEFLNSSRSPYRVCFVKLVQENFSLSILGSVRKPVARSPTRQKTAVATNGSPLLTVYINPPTAPQIAGANS